MNNTKMESDQIKPYLISGNQVSTHGRSLYELYKIKRRKKCIGPKMNNTKNGKR